MDTSAHPPPALHPFAYLLYDYPAFFSSPQSEIFRSLSQLKVEVLKTAIRHITAHTQHLPRSITMPDDLSFLSKQPKQTCVNYLTDHFSALSNVIRTYPLQQIRALLSSSAQNATAHKLHYSCMSYILLIYDKPVMMAFAASLLAPLALTHSFSDLDQSCGSAFSLSFEQQVLHVADLPLDELHSMLHSIPKDCRTTYDSKSRRSCAQALVRHVRQACLDLNQLDDINVFTQYICLFPLYDIPKTKSEVIDQLLTLRFPNNLIKCIKETLTISEKKTKQILLNQKDKRSTFFFFFFFSLQFCLRYSKVW
jgi:hypothetical protein